MAAALAGWLGIGIASAQPADGGASGALAVPVVPAQTGLRVARSEWNGVVQAVQESTLAAQVQGRIDHIGVRAGDRVDAGQELARIDARETVAGLAQARARLAQARAALAGVESTHERNRRLFEQGFISRSSLDASQTQLAAARATVAEALAGVERQTVTGTYTAIQAPYDGIVAEVMAEVGEIAQPGRELLRIHAPDALRVSLRVPAGYAADLDPGAVARVRVGVREVVAGTDGRPGMPASGTIWSEPIPLRVMPAADPGSATVELRIDLPQELAAGLRPGEYLRVVTERPAGAGLFVPARAVMMRGELKAAYVAVDGRFVLRALRVGAAGDDRIEVLAGLREGERVAMDPVRAGLAGAVPVPADAQPADPAANPLQGSGPGGTR